MDLGLDGKLFLLGGASAGLGLAVAEVLVAEGAEVVLIGRSPERLEAVAKSLGPQATSVAADLASAEDIDRLVATVGDIDGVLINGASPMPGNVLDLSDDDWRESFQLMVGGPIHLLRGLVPKFRDGASALLVVSPSIRQTTIGLDTSNLFRPGLAAVSKSLARQLAPRIRMNVISPGAFDTERAHMLDETRAAAEGITFDERRRHMYEAISLGRYGDPAEFGRVAAFLLSPAASYITGVAIQVDGGYVTAVP